MAAFDFAVLLRPARSNVVVLDASAFDRKLECQRELRPVVRLNPADREWHRVQDLLEKRPTAPLVQRPTEAQHAVARAVIDGRVLKPALPCDAHELDVDLHTVTRSL